MSLPSHHAGALIVYRLALSSCLDGFLRKVQSIAAAISKPSDLPDHQLVNETLAWANVLRIVSTNIAFSRQLPEDKIQLFVEAYLNILLFSISCCAAHPAGTPSPDQPDSLNINGCMAMSFAFCSLLRRFPDVIIDLDSPVLAIDPTSSEASHQLQLQLVDKRAALYFVLHIVARKEYGNAHFVNAIYLFMATGLPFPVELSDPYHAAFKLSSTKARLDASEFQTFAKHLRVLQMEVCVSCGLARKLVPDMPSSFKYCGACGMAT